MSNVSRRSALQLMAGIGLAGLGSLVLGTPAWAFESSPEHFILQPNDWLPNNARLPVLHYRQVLASGQIDALITKFDEMINHDGWPSAWHASIYEFHHYHPRAHEVLGFAGGTGELMLGGPGGRLVKVTTGDVVVLPVGTGHCQVSSTSDFIAVGGYPIGQPGDITRSPATHAMSEHMASLPVPTNDPVSGPGGPLTKLWKQA